MTIAVTILNEAGAPMTKGLGVELLRGATIVATALLDELGTATFAVEDPGPFAVRLRIGPELVLPRPRAG